MIKLRLDIVPVPKERHRATKSGHVYTPKRTSEYERAVARLVRHLPAQLGALAVDIIFVLKRPARTPKTMTGRFMKAGSKGDLDNYVKSLLDGCQRGGVIPNDSAVTKLNAYKVYSASGEEPHIELEIWPLGDIVSMAENGDLENIDVNITSTAPADSDGIYNGLTSGQQSATLARVMGSTS